MKHSKPESRAGYAMLAVLLVLVSLLFLVAPFLATVKNADQTSRRRADDTAASLALDDAARLARARLAGSHPSKDITPFSDGLEELYVHNDLDPEFLYGGPGGARWDVEVEDLAGRVDLDSAPPAMIANMLGLTTRLTQPLGSEDTTVHVASTTGFPERGVLWVAGELVTFGKKTNSSFTELQRGLGATVVDGEVLPGPLPAQNASAGAAVMDQRAWALAQWRVFDVPVSDQPGGRREPRALGSLDRLAQVADFVLDGAWGNDELAPLFDYGGVWGAHGGGPVWLPATLSMRPVVAGETDTLDVAEPRWFNPGTTVRVHGDGVSELALVRAVNPRTGRLYLDRPLANEQQAMGAVVEPLARRAVNANTASKEVLEALFVNLQLVGRNARITQAEARQVAELIVASRPLKGFKDFAERIVLPAAGLAALPADAPVIPEILRADDAASLSGFLDPDDALALYRNALCANDIELASSTMPLRFTSRDVYRFDLRVSVTAKSGIERLERVREEVHRAAPRGDLLRLWSLQEDFEEELRLSRLAKLWNTGPNVTTRFDSFLGTSPPSRFQPHLGSDAFHAGLSVSSSNSPGLERTFADRETEGWIQPLPSRASEAGPFSGHVLHFDWEPESNLGRDVLERPLLLQTADPKVAWTDAAANSLCKPIAFSAWIRPRTTGGYLLDLGGSSVEADRISLFVDGSDLVLRVLDGAGDHPATSFEEVGEVRYPLDQAPGLPADTWSHVLIDVRGNRPDQMLLMVDARPAPNTPGLTSLASSLSFGSDTITVESTDGFPDPCVLRIGEELIEANVTGQNTFTASFQQAGQLAGFGGRLARERFVSSSGAPPLINTGLGKTTTYNAGTPVQLYGYSLPLAAAVSSASSNLPVDLGPFAVARAIGAVGGQSSDGDAISWLTGVGVTLDLGTGIEGTGTSVTGIRLAPADFGRDPAEVMTSFSRSGGYAVLAQLAGGLRIGSETANETIAGTPLFEMEVFHYSGWSGDELLIDRRGDACTELTKLLNSPLLSSHAFVFNWYPSWSTTDGDTIANLLNWQTFVVPISLPVQGGGGTFGFPTPGPNQSEFAQLTRLADAEMTEWVRYDEVASNQLVRSDPTFLTILGNALAGGLAGGGDVTPPPPGGGGGGTPPSEGGGGTSSPPGTGPGILFPMASSAASSPPPTSSAPMVLGPYWENVVGVEEYDEWPLSLAIQTQFQFRGVLGTFSHKQPAGTLVLPVLRMQDGGPESGWPGRLDRAFLMDYDPTAPGWPVTVHRAYRPGEYFATSWQPAPDSSTQPLEAETGVSLTAMPDLSVLPGELLVALQEAAPVPIAPGVAAGVQGQTVYDIRETSRMLKFPSGERPRYVNQASLGLDIKGGGAADALVDEAAFLSSGFGLSTGAGLPVLGSGMVLATALGSSGGGFRVQPYAVRRAGGLLASPTPILDELPGDAGLLRIGSEILCYASLDGPTGDVILATDGRGLLGSKIQEHAVGELVTFLEEWPVSLLGAPISADDSILTLESRAGFDNSGLVLVGEELVHYTRSEGDGLVMPRASETPGAREQNGGGLFRGRFGTRPNGHSAGSPVIAFPFRFWDRWTLGADAPELSFFGFEASEPDAYWRSVFWSADYERGGAYIGCLLRTDPSVPWDADPATTRGLYLFEGGAIDAGGNPLGFQSGRVEARLFTRYREGSFDFLDGLSHGWKQGPRVRAFGFEYLAPGAVFERTWK